MTGLKLLVVLLSKLTLQLLAKKVFTLYSLAMQQLSKQDHYDFGLRALTSLLRYAGKKRRDCGNIRDEEVRLCLTSYSLPLPGAVTAEDVFASQADSQFNKGTSRPLQPKDH